MNNRFIEVLDICLSAMQTGVPIESCINLFPDLADDLRPFLETAEMAHNVDVYQLPDGIMERSRLKILNHAAKLKKSNRNPFGFFVRIPKLVYIAIFVTLFFFISSSGLVAASAQSLPGDRLYPVKRAVEQIQVDLVVSGKNKRHIEADQTQKRIAEVADLISLRRENQVSFEGIVNEINDGSWQVGEIPVRLEENTIRIGDIQVGNLVEVEGRTTIEGYVLAEEVHRRNYIFFGQVDEIDPDIWIISGNEFIILSETQIDQSVELGNQVLVMVRSDDNDIHYALAIFRLSDGTDYIQPGGVSAESENGYDQLEIIGVVESIQPGLWIVSGQKVYVNPSTEIKNQVHVGDTVTIHIKTGEGDIFVATEIEASEMSKSDDDQVSEGDGSGGDGSSSGIDEHTEEGDESENGSESSSENPTQVAPQSGDSSEDNSGDENNNSGSNNDAGDDKSESDEPNQGSPDDPDNENPDDPNHGDENPTPTPEDSDDDDDNTTPAPEDPDDDDDNSTPTPDVPEEEEDHP